MSTTETDFKIGEWVVHRDYGAGQIQAIETKDVAGVNKRYYAIQTGNLMIWLPLDQNCDEWLRPIVPVEKLAEVLTVLDDAAEPLPDHTGARTRLLRSISLLESPVKIARAVRSLWALRRARQGLLSTSDRHDWQRLLSGLAAEWGALKGIEMATAREQIESRLRQNRRTAQPA